MQLAVRTPMTKREFLECEERQELRYEFDGFEPVAMTGGTAAHSAIQRNLAIIVDGRLRGTPGQFFGSDLKVETVNGYRYPDSFVVCTWVDPRTTIVNEPVVIFEVLSSSSGGTDLVTKNHEYAAIPSVQRYVILGQEAVAGTMFERIGDDWVGHLLGAEAVLQMPEIGIEVALSELYEGIEVPSREQRT